MRDALFVRVQSLLGGSGRDRGAAVAEFAMISVLPDLQISCLGRARLEWRTIYGYRRLGECKCRSTWTLSPLRYPLGSDSSTTSPLLGRASGSEPMALASGWSSAPMAFASGWRRTRRTRTGSRATATGTRHRTGQGISKILALDGLSAELARVWRSPGL